MTKQFFWFLAVICLRTASAANINVSAGNDLQAALNLAQPGDTITLAAGATFVGHFYLPPRPGSQWITIQSSAMNALPAAGVRVAATDAVAMPKLVTPDGDPVLRAGQGANYYRVQGIEFAPASKVYVQDLIRLGLASESTVAQLPHDLDFDRDYIHGDPVAGSKRGIALNNVATTIENSYISGFTSTGQDTQAICGWNGPGPFTIINNYLEAGTEIVAFGGAYISIPMNVPSDILIKNNTFFKPLSWRPGDASYAGSPIWAKNHIELKNGQRVTIDGNTFTNNWIGADQQGFVFVFGVRTEGNMVPWAVVRDVTVKNNIIRHAAAGALFMGRDGIGGSASRFVIQNNIWEDLNPRWGGDGRLFQIQSSVYGVTIDHNTAFEAGWLAVFADSLSFNVNFTNNIFTLGAGIIGAGSGVGAPSLAAYDIGGVFSNNVVIGTSLYPYPAGNFFPSSPDQVGFTDFSNSNFLLTANSPYKGMATSGDDLGSSLRPATPGIPGGWVNIISKNSGKCLDFNNASPVPATPAIQRSCLGGDSQKFQLTPVSGGYRVTAKHSGLALEMLGGPGVTWDGGIVDQWPYWGGASQIWQLTPTGDGYFDMKLVHSGLCMDVAGLSKDDGAAVMQWSCWGGDNQKWSFQPVH